jgi:hypothetical protein
MSKNIRDVYIYIEEIKKKYLVEEIKIKIKNNNKINVFL